MLTQKLSDLYFEAVPYTVLYHMMLSYYVLLGRKKINCINNKRRVGNKLLFCLLFIVAHQGDIYLTILTYLARYLLQ